MKVGHSNLYAPKEGSAFSITFSLHFWKRHAGQSLPQFLSEVGRQHRSSVAACQILAAVVAARISAERAIRRPAPY